MFRGFLYYICTTSRTADQHQQQRQTTSSRPAAAAAAADHQHQQTTKQQQQQQSTHKQQQQQQTKLFMLDTTRCLQLGSSTRVLNFAIILHRFRAGFYSTWPTQKKKQQMPTCSPRAGGVEPVEGGRVHKIDVHNQLFQISEARPPHLLTC